MTYEGDVFPADLKLITVFRLRAAWSTGQSLVEYFEATKEALEHLPVPDGLSPSVYSFSIEHQANSQILYMRIMLSAQNCSGLIEVNGAAPGLVVCRVKQRDGAFLFEKALRADESYSPDDIVGLAQRIIHALVWLQSE